MGEIVGSNPTRSIFKFINKIFLCAIIKIRFTVYVTVMAEVDFGAKALISRKLFHTKVSIL